MAGPNTSYEGASHIISGQHVAATEATPLGQNVPCRRVLLYADEGDTVYIGAQGLLNAANGFRLPSLQADGNVTPVEMWVNNVEVIYVVGAAGGETVYWVAEEV